MAIEILMPALSPTMEEGTLAKWHVKVGDTVSAGDIIAEIETDKATMEFEAVDEGEITELLVAEGTQGVKINQPIAAMSGDGTPVVPAKPQPAALDRTPAPRDAPPPEPPRQARQQSDRLFASPLARRLAQEQGIDLANVRGSGPRGRIVKRDIEEIASGQAATITPKELTAPPAALPPSNIAGVYADRKFAEVELDGMRKTIAERLTTAKQTIPHFYLRRSIVLDELLAFRKQLNQSLQSRGVKLSINDFIIKACAVALQHVPDCNAVWANDRILKFEESDIAVAVAIEGGLFTPVIRDADTKTLSKISQEMKGLAQRAKDRKLSPSEYQGGSFAISNLGMMGIENFDAVINPPHGSILAVGAGVRSPIVDNDGNVGTATVMSVTLSVDHRVIDGATGAEFLSAIKDNLENPVAMLA